MASARNSARAANNDAASPRRERAASPPATDCAVCSGPLPAEHRYLCATCVADSEQRAGKILSSLTFNESDASKRELATANVEVDEIMECPKCSGPLDAGGRCAMCVTTVRR